MRELKKTFEDELRNVLIRYAENITNIENERWKKLKSAESFIEEDEIDYRYDEQVSEIEEKVSAEIKSLSEKYGLKTMTVWDCIDEHTYASGMGWWHKRLVMEAVAIRIDSKVKRYIAKFTESYVYGDYKFKFDELITEVVPLISKETTPFTYQLVENVPWDLIRDTWQHVVNKYINQIAEGEIQGRLEETISDVEAKLKAGSWVYDINHLLEAIEKTKRKI